MQKQHKNPKAKQNRSYVLEIGERPLILNDPNRFKRPEEETAKLKEMKKANLKNRREDFGSDANKHLNSHKDLAAIEAAVKATMKK